MTFTRHGETQDISVESAKIKALAMIDARLSEFPEDYEERVKELEAKKLEDGRDEHHRAYLDQLRRDRVNAGIPDRYLEASFSLWEPTGNEQETFRSEVMQWKRDQFKAGASMVFRGGVGTGKTWAACGLLSDALQNGFSGLYSTAKAYTGKVKETYRRDAKEAESDVLGRFSGVDLLVLDEIGRQFETQTEHLYLFDLVNERYNKGKPTIFLTNLDGEEFKTFVGDAILDRLKEGGSLMLSLNWPSRRGV